MRRRNISKILRLIPADIGLLIALSSGVCEAKSPWLDHWRKTHEPESFTGRVWVRVRINGPPGLLYAVIVDSETNPYTPMRRATGTITASGLQPRGWTNDNDWGRPLAWIPPAAEKEWLRPGRHSVWVELPASSAAQWHTAFFIRTRAETPSQPLLVRLEFATEASEQAIFHVVNEPTDAAGVVSIRMPSEGGLAGLEMLESYGEWAERRASLAKAAANGPPPELKRIRVGTWANLSNYRAGGGPASNRTADLAFQTFALLGVNSVTVGGVSDTTMAEMAKKYHVIDTTLTEWTSLASCAKQDDASTLDERWRRVFDDHYARRSEEARRDRPFAFSLATHINLGDEIHSATTARAIQESPPLLAFFRDWLAGEGLNPSIFGAASWQEVRPIDDRSQAQLVQGTIAGARLFYHTRRFIDHYTAIYYRAAVEAVRRHFPNGRLITVNYQAGPMQFGFVGNNNDTDKGMLDIFHYGRERSLQGVMLEDWTPSNDWCVGRIGLGVEMMRAAARKHRLPLAVYLVGRGVRARFQSYLMHGVREIGLYLYGPVSNIGPAWGDDPDTLAEVADLTRQIKRVEDLLAHGVVRPSRAALLVATTSDIMQRQGLYFCPERQNIHMALKHGYLPVEVVFEQEIAGDDALDRYAVLYVTDPQVRLEVQKKIAAWVMRGGRLFVGVGGACWDEHSQACRVLDPVLGVKGRVALVQTGGLQLVTPSYSSAVRKYDYRQLETLRISRDFLGEEIRIPAWGMTLKCAPDTARVLGVYSDDSPALLMNAYGQGEAMLVGALLGEAYMGRRYPAGESRLSDVKNGKDVLRVALAMAERAGLSKPAELSIPGIYTSVMDSEGAALLFLNNVTGEAIPSISARLAGYSKAVSVESLSQGRRAARIEDGALQFDLPLEHTDIVVIRP
ncbi:MAG: hypothetical protein JXO72_14965 [Vicinamibacteria bacterium]|nr:hypothetical protein [Vicinamibacteria bacterium]